MNIKKAAVLGTGTMGHGISQICAMAGLHVNMYGRSDASLERGFTKIENSLKDLMEEGKLTDCKVRKILSRINGVKSIEAASSGAEIIIECLAEDLQLKQKIFNKLDSICSREVILATNTSGLSPTKISEAVNYPERVVVAHFWNPPQFIPLVEVVPGKHTSGEIMDRTMEFIDFIGKKGVRLEKECPGFIGNRLQLALLREALYIVEQGFAKPEEVDKAVEYSFGRRLPATGPLCSADMGGLDIFYNISSYLFRELCSSKDASEMLKQLVDAGKLGLKAGNGFYNWTDDFSDKKQEERTRVLKYFLQQDNK
ncbi:MAG: 3-hydroxyacyl-CoA dehydrogenase family protein [Clostridium sp.]|jgi:3-hydroxybutyryl-CoA dehydrogenase|uniref:3-hydroxyacyl-CoA dehydrogenase family protein n=1 Tax=Clostridium sp. TaxID=1506 RepID=UPI0025BA4E18|nr:3-hydroxyacyl-CoA dehydrogenase family protein [Clostridium sp.]MCH3965014.1 3-hydroxyacyl-CoA dehydrogenase family protein [Clostridium sp.]MCI1714235.1 3-hydroxyacyl-CoA dehydrogenase family protein [Clostridium sp.]MCI1798497.1 3-hydroxyacyl-CoA dehydrogenase family protein [Clostridium sp.]MCI1812772.1 3-hydroxyacyl-CoA dehydrogenase family protein [Clostridium sp.]MCI1869306.1 3-hydroxyacyl-CoA dehydrogenase family protein [Clostridium sp.]